jgi:hypothetical protein
MPISTRLVAIRGRDKATTPDVLAARLERITADYAQELWTIFRIYPATVSTTYVRTGRLRDEWRIFRSEAAGNISYVLVNEARNPRTHQEYAKFVMGNFDQSAAAANLGWKKVKDIVDRKHLANLIQAAIHEALK